MSEVRAMRARLISLQFVAGEFGICAFFQIAKRTRHKAVEFLYTEFESLLYLLPLRVADPRIQVTCKLRA